MLQKLPDSMFDASRFRPGLSQLLSALHLLGEKALLVRIDIFRTYSRPLLQVPPDPRLLLVKIKNPIKVKFTIEVIQRRLRIEAG